MAGRAAACNGWVTERGRHWGWELAKVYVSSTIADLTGERRAVLDWLRLARHQAVDSYLPDSDTVRDSCLEDVAGCDLYVLIAGHRYGFQPSDGNPEGLSITQLEFQRAGECGIPRVALLRTSIPDVSLSDLADPQRLAQVSAFRDEVARQVRAAEFGDLQGLIQGLSTGVQGQLDKLAKRDEGQAAPVTAGPVLRLAPRPVFLAGREKLLAELEARLAGGDGSEPRVVALWGLGGAGKSSVAVEYAHRRLSEVGVAWQLPAEDPAVLAAGFGELATQLGTAEGGDPVAVVHGALAASQVPWLLVFDNAPDRASVARFVPPAGPGRVLITSRNQIWPPGQALEVPVLDWQVAGEFLVSRTGDADRRAALELAGELGGLPLALEQAAAYVQASGGSLAGYLASFLRRRADLLSRGEPTGYPETVATTWKLTFEDLQQAAPGAAGLLRLLAFCAPEAIPLHPLLQPRPGLAGQLAPEVAPVLAPLLEDELAAGDAIAVLRRYSLISPPADGSVSVHRLVQAVTADQMPAKLAQAWRQAAAAVIEAAIPADPNLPETWPTCAALLPHAQAALNLTSGGMWQIASYLGDSGSYPAARDLSQLIAEACRDDDAYGAEHPYTLSARGSLARWTGEAGDPAAARDQFAALLPIHERVLGPEHPDTLTTRSELARWTGKAGDAAGARDQTAALLPSRSGSSAPNTRTPSPPAAASPTGPGRRGTRPVRATSAPPCCPSRSGSSAPNTRQSSPPVATSPAGPGRRGTRPVHATSTPPCCRCVRGSSAPSTRTPSPSAVTSPPGPGRRATRPVRVTSSPPCCRCVRGSSAPSTRPPFSPVAASPAGPGRRAARPPPGTSSPPCCPSRSGSSAPNTRTPSPPGVSSPAGPGRRGTRPVRATRPPPCCPSRSGSSAPSTRTPSPSAPTSPPGPGRPRRDLIGDPGLTGSSFRMFTRAGSAGKPSLTSGP